MSFANQLIPSDWLGARSLFFWKRLLHLLLRQFFLGLPRELSEAARIEGASELQILWHIILPLVRRALFTVALLQFLFSWTDFLGPLIYLNDQSKFTLALGLANMQSGSADRLIQRLKDWASAMGWVLFLLILGDDCSGASLRQTMGPLSWLVDVSKSGRLHRSQILRDL
jgi:hypothetical protein